MIVYIAQIHPIIAILLFTLCILIAITETNLPLHTNGALSLILHKKNVTENRKYPGCLVFCRKKVIISISKKAKHICVMIKITSVQACLYVAASLIFFFVNEHIR